MSVVTFSGPRLETERLVLRLPMLSDFDAFAAFLASERSRFLGGSGYDRLQSWRSFGHLTGHWPLRGYGSFVMERKDDAAPLGMAGPFCPEGWPEPEFGWAIWSGADEGKGYVAEAMDAVKTWAWDALGWTTCVSYIDPENEASIRVAEKLGAVRDETAATPDTPGDSGPVLVYRHTAPEAA